MCVCGCVMSEFMGPRSILRILCDKPHMEAQHENEE